MGLFDSYEPVPPIACPHCNAILRDWQGKQGPCVLVTWRQGEANPVRGPSPTVDEDPSWLLRWALPETFEFYSFCDCNHETIARGTAQAGVWKHSEVIRTIDLDSIRV